MNKMKNKCDQIAELLAGGHIAELASQLDGGTYSKHSLAHAVRKLRAAGADIEDAVTDLRLRRGRAALGKISAPTLRMRRVAASATPKVGQITVTIPTLGAKVGSDVMVFHGDGVMVIWAKD